LIYFENSYVHRCSVRHWLPFLIDQLRTTQKFVEMP
jgi:hypothetical protein